MTVTRKPALIPFHRCGRCGGRFFTAQEAAEPCDEHDSSMTRYLSVVDRWVLFGSAHKATARLVEVVVNARGEMHSRTFETTSVVEVETACGITTVVLEEDSEDPREHRDCTACYPPEVAP